MVTTVSGGSPMPLVSTRASRTVAFNEATQSAPAWHSPATAYDHSHRALSLNARVPADADVTITSTPSTIQRRTGPA